MNKFFVGISFIALCFSKIIYADPCSGLHEQVTDICIGDETSSLRINNQKFEVMKDFEWEDTEIDFDNNEPIAFISHQRFIKGYICDRKVPNGIYEDLNHIPEGVVFTIRYNHTNCSCRKTQCLDPRWPF